MVDAISRLFGKSTKKPSGSTGDDGAPSPVGTNRNSTNLAEDEGFTLVGPSRTTNEPLQMYPALPAVPSRPTGSPAQPRPYPSETLASQSSMTLPHALDGVPFVLSPQCQVGNKKNKNETDNMLDDVGVQLQIIEQLLQTSNYDFRLEKSVIESDLTATMRRMQTY